MDGNVDTTHAGFGGSGFVDGTNQSGASIQWQVNANTAGNYGIEVRYANGSTASRGATLQAVNAGFSATMSFDITSEWTNWQTEAASISLMEGSNTISLSALTDAGLANIDSITLVGEGLSSANCSTRWRFTRPKAGLKPVQMPLSVLNSTALPSSKAAAPSPFIKPLVVLLTRSGPSSKTACTSVI